MPLGSAHRLVPEATFIDPDPDADRATVEAAFEALAAFSPGIAGSADPLTPRSGCSRSRSTGSRRCGGRSRSSSGGWPRRSDGPGRAATRRGRTAIRAGIAGTRFTATSPPSSPGPAAPNLVPPGGEADFLAPHPSGLLTADPDVRARLTRFGLRRIGPVAELARSALVARFGEEGARIHARARGEELEPFRPRRTPERLWSSPCPSNPPVEDLEPLRFVLHRLAGALTGQLVARGLAASRAQPAPRPGPRVRSGRDARPSWTSSSASPSRPPTPRRSSACCSPGSSGPRHRPRSRGSGWSSTGRPRRPVSSSRCSRRRPPVAPGSSGSSPGWP